MQFYTTNDDELTHYGVVGMRWGVRKGNTQAAYTKASKKLAKLDAKASKYQKKADKYTVKAQTRYINRDGYAEMAKKNRRKALKNMRKAEKWYKQMDKAFKNTDVKLTEQQAAIGRRYMQNLDMKQSAYY